MITKIGQYFAGLPSFFGYFSLALLLLVGFVLVYTQATPHHEFKLIKDNNASAALAFGGSVLGFVLPMHAVITHSVSLLDCALWGIVALIVQLLTFFLLRMVLRDLSARITRNELAAGIFVATSSIAVGALNAACMSY
jgi:putative membrane protein